jgi:hypothetical protein
MLKSMVEKKLNDLMAFHEVLTQENRADIERFKHIIPKYSNLRARERKGKKISESEVQYMTKFKDIFIMLAGKIDEYNDKCEALIYSIRKHPESFIFEELCLTLESSMILTLQDSCLIDNMFSNSTKSFINQFSASACAKRKEAIVQSLDVSMPNVQNLFSA